MITANYLTVGMGDFDDVTGGSDGMGGFTELTPTQNVFCFFLQRFLIL